MLFVFKKIVKCQTLAIEWCARQDSNLRPLAPETNALSPELRALNHYRCRTLHLKNLLGNITFKCFHKIHLSRALLFLENQRFIFIVEEFFAQRGF